MTRESGVYLGFHSGARVALAFILSCICRFDRVVWVVGGVQLVPMHLFHNPKAEVSVKVSRGWSKAANRPSMSSVEPVRVRLCVLYVALATLSGIRAEVMQRVVDGSRL